MPFTLLYGNLLANRLTLVKQAWGDQRELPPNLGTSEVKYLSDLNKSLEIAHKNAEEHTKRAQARIRLLWTDMLSLAGLTLCLSGPVRMGKLPS